MAKKENTTLLIVGALAVVGYMAFRSGGFLNKGFTAATPLPVPSPAPVPQFSNPMDIGIATELPSAPDVGIYVPKLDPTGMSIQLF